MADGFRRGDGRMVNRNDTATTRVDGTTLGCRRRSKSRGSNTAHHVVTQVGTRREVHTQAERSDRAVAGRAPDPYRKAPGA